MSGLIEWFSHIIQAQTIFYRSLPQTSKNKLKLKARSCVRPRVGVEITIDWTRLGAEYPEFAEKKVHIARGEKMQRLPLMMIKYIESELSSNKSRKNCANSDIFFLMFRMWNWRKRKCFAYESTKTMMGPARKASERYKFTFPFDTKFSPPASFNATIYDTCTHILSIETFPSFSNLIIYLYSFFSLSLSA